MLKKANNVFKTKNVIGAIQIAIKQAYFNNMKTTTVASLNLGDMVDKSNEDKDLYVTLFDILGELSITDAMQITEGYPQEIANSLMEEEKEKKLSSVKVKLL